ncbi:MAG: hypothetical protein JSS37_02635 [Proteobacteria bacterium]|nr:hypothetical protein [Pseudomonadota bacterium]
MKHPLQDVLYEFITARTKCGNCEKPFTRIGKPKTVVGIKNGNCTSCYLLCESCARKLKAEGLPGIPHAAKDAKLAALLHASPAGGEA